MKKLNFSNFIKNSYYFNKNYTFYNIYFFENYKTDMVDYHSLENLNYKVFIESVFFKKPKAFKIYLNKNSLQNLQKKTNIQHFISSIMSNGNKLKFVKFLNYVNNNFYYSFIHKSIFLQNKFENYLLFYNFSRENEFFFNFDFILNNILSINESIFNIKVIKLNKRTKKKLKKKYDFEVKYLKKSKRSGAVFKSIHLYSNSYNYYNYHERLLASFLTTFFFQKNSKIYKKKILAYSSILKKKSFN